jgi:hypothetical protein
MERLGGDIGRLGGDMGRLGGDMGRLGGDMGRLGGDMERLICGGRLMSGGGVRRWLLYPPPCRRSM